MRLWIILMMAALLSALLSACSTAPRSPPSAQSSTNKATDVAPTPTPPTPPRATSQTLPVLPAAGSGRGGYYQDDGPGDNPPAGLHDTPNAEPKIELPSKTKNKPYVVFGKTYTPILDERPFKQRGIGSWYGKKFHGQRTSSGEIYDMYKMTAAHPTLPIPSYARITSLDNGRQVIVRINDRGPFHASRIADLSYTAALKLGFLGKGSHEIEIERLLPEEITRLSANRNNGNNGTNSSGTAPSSGIVSVAPAAIETMLRTDQSLLTPEPHEAKPDTTVPAPIPTIMPTAMPTALSALKNGFYLQLGAFTLADNAEQMRTKLAQDWADSNLPSLEIVQAGSIYRLFSGPFTTRTEANNAAQRAQNSGTTKPLVVQRPGP